MRGGLQCAVIAFAVTVSAPHASAQTSSTVQATAAVLSAITLTGTDLAFGTVTPTQTKTVAPAAGGKFTITLEKNTATTVTFGLPATLGPNVAIGTYRALRAYNNNPVAGVLSSPSDGSTMAVSSPTGSVQIWIGATLTTTAAAAGSYSAPIVLTLIYN